MIETGPVGKRLRQKLEAAFGPGEIAIEDESARHAGHAGERAGGESHFRVRIVSGVFEGMSRLERQRRVYAVLAEEIEGGLHALALTTLTPQEVARG